MIDEKQVEERARKLDEAIGAPAGMDPVKWRGQQGERMERRKATVRAQMEREAAEAAKARRDAEADDAERAAVGGLATAEERKRARDRIEAKQRRRNDGKDWTPVVGTDNYEYPAHIYADAYGAPMKTLTRQQKADRERRFRETHGTEWQL